MAIPKSVEDVLNPNFRVSENPDNEELEGWLSWLPSGVFKAYIEVANSKLNIEDANQKYEVTRAKEWINLPDDKEMNVTTKKVVIEANDNVIAAYKEVSMAKHVYVLAEATLKMLEEKSGGVRKIATLRANSIQMAEDTEWTARQNRKTGGIQSNHSNNSNKYNNRDDDSFYPSKQEVPSQLQQTFSSLPVINNNSNSNFNGNSNNFSNQQVNNFGSNVPFGSNQPTFNNGDSNLPKFLPPKII